MLIVMPMLIMYNIIVISIREWYHTHTETKSKEASACLLFCHIIGFVVYDYCSQVLPLSSVRLYVFYILYYIL